MEIRNLECRMRNAEKKNVKFGKRQSPWSQVKSLLKISLLNAMRSAPCSLLYHSTFPPGRRCRPLWAGGRLPTSEFQTLSSDY